MYVVLEYFDNKLNVTSVKFIILFKAKSTLEPQHMLDIFVELQKLFQENILKNQ